MVEARRFQESLWVGQMMRSGMLLLLLLRWGELPSAHQISRLLGLDRRTVVRYLRELVRLGFIERHPKKNSYRLAQQLNEEQRLLLAFLDPTQPRGA